MNDSSPRQDDEKQIIALLLSCNEEDRQAGLVWLAGKYRQEVCGYVRFWSNTCRAAFAAQDLPDVWADVLYHVWNNVNGEERRFEVNGSLPAFLKCIAYRRAVDKLRRRSLLLFPTLPDVPVMDEVGTAELLEAISESYGCLSENLQMVLRVDVRLFFQEFKWPSLSELTAAVNEEFGLLLDEAAVKSRRYRARDELIKCLRSRGYQW